MQQFVVPQFIEVEDKILGPVTTRQFLIMLAAALVLFVVYRLADFALFIVMTLVIGGSALVFAFVKVNGQTFHYFVLNIFQTTKHPSLRVWRKHYSKDELEYMRKHAAVEKVMMATPKKQVKRSHIRDLALSVNTGGYYQPDSLGQDYGRDEK